MGKKITESKADLNLPSNKKPTKQTGQISKDAKHQECPNKCESVHDPSIERLITKQATSALLYLLFYSILMFTLPFGAFFGTRHVLREHSDLSDFAINSLSVASSVVTVYIIIALYAYKAYNEQDIITSKKCKQCKKFE